MDAFYYRLLALPGTDEKRKWLLKRRGCVMADSDNGFVSRNGEPFHHERTVQRGYDIQMQ